MKNFIKFFVILIGCLLIFEAFGARPDTTMVSNFSASQIPRDIDTWLADKESKIKYLKPNAAKEIIWNDENLKNKTKISIVYIHGFAASKAEMNPTAQLIAKQIGANLYFTRLSGHGRDNMAMSKPSLSDWANDMVEAISIGERLGEKVIVIAVATGATLATWALRHPEYSKNIMGLISFSPNFALNGLSNGVLNMPWAQTLLPIIYGKFVMMENQGKVHSKNWILKIPVEAVIKLGTLLKVVSKTEFNDIKTPHLYFYSIKDKIVLHNESKATIKRWGGPTHSVAIENSLDKNSHVLSGNILAPNSTQKVVDEAVKWINDHSN